MEELEKLKERLWNTTLENFTKIVQPFKLKFKSKNFHDHFHDDPQAFLRVTLPLGYNTTRTLTMCSCTQAGSLLPKTDSNSSSDKNRNLGKAFLFEFK
jgi:hypothetical protein